MKKTQRRYTTFDRHLRVRTSKIPGSGKGLFTTVDIPKGAFVTEYRGRLCKWSKVKDQDGYNGYIFKLNNTWAIDALGTLTAKGRYANDARGLNRLAGCRNNSEYVTRGKRCFIATTRRIRKGEELFVDYGQAYWRLIKKLLGKGLI
ncbi:MAG: SET domain-containing protein [Bacteroidota bacterium]